MEGTQIVRRSTQRRVISRSIEDGAVRDEEWEALHLHLRHLVIHAIDGSVLDTDGHAIVHLRQMTGHLGSDVRLVRAVLAVVAEKLGNYEQCKGFNT